MSSVTVPTEEWDSIIEVQYDAGILMVPPLEKKTPGRGGQHILHPTHRVETLPFRNLTEGAGRLLIVYTAVTDLHDPRQTI